MRSTTQRVYSYRQQLQQSAFNGRVASVLVGSGALRQCGAGIYADWTTILNCTADYLGVECDPTLMASHPTIAWEVLMRKAAKARDVQANECEEKARNFVGSLVKECEQQLERNRNSIAAESLFTFIERRMPRSVMTLNFTPAPFCPTATSPLSTDDVVEYSVQSCPIWCMHGSRAKSDGLRLGVVRYSALINSFTTWRNEYSMHRAGAPCLDQKREGVNAHHRFVADVMESPLLIAGCGLRQAEWTLWWLLASKARNEARHESCPSAYITADALDDAQRLALEGLHCNVIQVPCHADVWSMLEFLMER
jgi:hypothetical protein